MIIFFSNSHNKNSVLLQIWKEDGTFRQRILDHFFFDIVVLFNDKVNTRQLTSFDPD